MDRQFLEGFLGCLLSGPVPYEESVKQDITKQLLELLQMFPHLELGFSQYVANNGRTLDMLEVEGTIPVNHQGAEYNISILVSLPERYSQEAPLVYVTHTNDMIIKSGHPFVDPSGTVRTPYISHWTPNSDISSACQELAILFGAELPVYTRPLGHVPPSHNALQTAHGQTDGDEEMGALRRAGRWRPVASLELQTHEEAMLSSTDMVRGSGIVLFAYPKANTNRCTAHAVGFSKMADVISQAGYEVYGISADRPSVQAAWRQQEGITFKLLCDPFKRVLRELGFLQLSGDEIKRSHIIIGKGGQVVDVQYGVAPEASVDAAVAYCLAHAAPVGAPAAAAAATAAAARPAGASSTAAQQPLPRMPKLQGKLVGLCIGVAKYARSELLNPGNDAEDMAARLRSCGVDTTCVLDPDIVKMKKCINDLLVKAKRNTELAFFYFAGHGAFSAASAKHVLCAQSWKGYSQSQGGFARTADEHGYALEDLVQKLEATGSRRIMVLVDACRVVECGQEQGHAEEVMQSVSMWRSNDVARAPTGRPLLGATLLCHACSKQQEASDGTPGENGVYTAALLKHLFNNTHPNVMTAIYAANSEVMRVTSNQQVPKLEVADGRPFQQFVL